MPAFAPGVTRTWAGLINRHPTGAFMGTMPATPVKCLYSLSHGLIDHCINFLL